MRLKLVIYLETYNINRIALTFFDDDMLKKWNFDLPPPLPHWNRYSTKDNLFEIQTLLYCTAMHDIYQMMEIVSPIDFVFAGAFWDFGMPGQPLALAANGIEK